jgi:hypothetical protein
VPCGWRGPYLRLPIGKSELRDGWGRALDLFNASASLVSAGQAIAAVGSRGADGDLGGTDYNADLSLSFLNPDRTSMTVSGNVYVLVDGQRQNPADPSQVRVVLYGPDTASAACVQGTPVPTTVAGGVVSYSAATTIGPRFLRAYLGNPVTNKSAIVRFQRGDVIHLEIR